AAAGHPRGDRARIVEELVLIGNRGARDELPEAGFDRIGAAQADLAGERVDAVLVDVECTGTALLAVALHRHIGVARLSEGADGERIAGEHEVVAAAQRASPLPAAGVARQSDGPACSRAPLVVVVVIAA